MIIGKQKTHKVKFGGYPYANLTPNSHIETIEAGVAKRSWIRIFSMSLILSLVAVGGAVSYRFIQQTNYDSVIKDQALVELQITKYADIDKVISIRDSTLANLQTAGANSIAWADLYRIVMAGLPEGTTITSFRATNGGVSETVATTAVAITVYSQAPIDFTTLINNFHSIPGVFPQTVIIGNVTGGETGYQYPVAFGVDTSVLMKFFTSEEKDRPELALSPGEKAPETKVEENATTDSEGDTSNGS